MNLLPHHREEFHRSGLSDETIARARVYSAPGPQVRDILGYGAGPGYVIPYQSLNGSGEYARVKIDHPGADGKRYRSPSGAPNRLFVPFTISSEALLDVTTPLWITEGEKKALKACQEGLACVAVAGVFSWLTKAAPGETGPLPDLHHIAWQGRKVYLVFDADPKAKTIANVRKAERELAIELTRRGADVYSIRLPLGEGGMKCGLDDYLQTHSVEALCSIEPIPVGGTVAASGPVIICLAGVKPEKVEWLWQDRVARGKLALVIGESGVGKTHVTLDMTARITTGSTWPDGRLAPLGNVILLTSEDGLADTVRPSIDRQGGDPHRIYILKAVRVGDDECPFTLEHNLPQLEASIKQTQATAVIISPLSAYLGSKDSYKDAEIRGLLTPLADLAERTRVAIIGIMHLTKAQTNRLLLRAQGSVAFVAQARTVLAVGEVADPPGRRLMASVKNNLGPPALALAFRISDTGLTWESGSVEGAADILLAGDPPESRSERQERDQAVQFLRDLLSNNAVVPSKEIMASATANGIAQRTLWRAKTELGIVAEKARGTDTGAWYWMLPREGQA